jgi:DNA modification methylase
MNRPTDSLQLHPDAGRVPEMGNEQWQAFLGDVRERGIRVPIEIAPGGNLILDGRSRWRAAKELGLPDVPVVDANVNGDDLVVYMIRAASRRRHLTDDQRACLAEEEREYLSAKLKQARSAKANAARHSKGSLQTAPIHKEKPAREKVAKEHRVSERKVQQASVVRRQNPELYKEVKRGDRKLAQAVRDVQREQKRVELEQKAAAAPPADDDSWRIITGDCVEELAKLPAGTARLVFADPPYNIGRDYHGQGAKADKLADYDYLNFCAQWIGHCVNRLAADGSLWVMIGNEYAAELCMLLKSEASGLHYRAWIKWHESFGVHNSSGQNFSRCSRHIFYFVKDPDRFVFNLPAVTVPSDRQLKYGDKRADPAGKVLGDVWTDSRLQGTSSEKIDGFDNQLPLALVQRIVECASDPGDLVIDPFNGTGTTAVASVLTGRRYIGIEKNEGAVEVARKRVLAEQAEKVS